MIYLAPVAALVLALAYLMLCSRPEPMGAYDQPTGRRFAVDDETKAAYRAFANALAEGGVALAKLPASERIVRLRQGLDGLGEAVEFEETLTPFAEGGVEGEWVLPKSGPPRGRILFVHGGFYTMGSPLSHRALTTRLARESGAAVFALRYSLLPEHARKQLLADVRRAWIWLAAAAPGEKLALMGDSAGGNLALAAARLASQAPSVARPAAVVALSPAVDTTMTAPSFKENRASDLTVGPALAPVLKLPAALWRLIELAQFRVWPNDPEISPCSATSPACPRPFSRPAPRKCWSATACVMSTRRARKGPKRAYSFGMACRMSGCS